MSQSYEKIIRMVYDKLGYVVDDEIIDILTSGSQHKLVVAPAGGTKTTLGQAYLMTLKLGYLVQAMIQNKKVPHSASTSYYTENLYCCVYNKHNVPDLLNVHKKMYYAFESLGVISNDPTSEKYSSDSMTASTLHSLAFSMIERNMGFFKLRTVKKASDIFLRMQLQAVVKNVLGYEVGNVSVYKELYDLYTNLMLYDKDNLDDLVFQIALSKVDVDESRLRDIFELYDTQKRRMKAYEYSDWLKMAVQLLEVPEIAAYYHDRFKVIIADEIQDFTKLMFKMYSKLVSNNTKTLAIGDPDQTIYQFNGASPENIDRYSELVGLEVEEFTLQINRRCMSNTFFFANNIINEVSDRKHREIRTMKTGGRFTTMTYENYADEVDNIIDEITKVHYGTTVIEFRKKLDALILSRRLYELGMNASYINAFPFNRHHLYSTFSDVLTSLFTHKTRDTWKNLFKILPFSKEKLADFFKFDQREMPTTMEEVQDWSYIDFSPLIRDSKMKDSVWFQVIFAQGVADNVSRLASNEYIQQLFELFWLNYYKYVAEDSDVFLKDVIEWAILDFSSPSTLKKVLKVKEDLEYNRIMYDRIHPITICTIHGTKGLEFDRVILAHMESDISHNRVLSQEAQQFEYDSDTRLYYVGATRQRSCLVLSYNKNRPHKLNDEKFMTPPLAVEVEEKFDNNPNLIASSLFNNDSSSLRRKLKI